jgi:TIGR00252 family protein
MPSSSKTIGKNIEVLVCDYLQRQGLQLITANYQCKCGEIDLIMRDAEILVFIEVRHRKAHDYGDGVSTVTKTKQRKIIKAANYYLQKNNLGNKNQCRFDVVATSGMADSEILWIKNAFWEKW